MQFYTLWFETFYNKNSEVCQLVFFLVENTVSAHFFRVVVPGTEELSGDDDMASTPPRQSKKDERGKGPKPRLKRPKILKHRGSRTLHNTGKEWGERCVDVFQVIAQIGEGIVFFYLIFFGKIC